jgi:hypothetical protein
VEQRLRDPFSPVGYTPPPATTGGSGTIGVSTTEAASRGPVDFHGLTTEEQAIIMQHLDVDGFLKQNDIYIAIINNQVLSPGDNLNITARGREYRFLVKKITPDNVVLHAAK